MPFQLIPFLVQLAIGFIVSVVGYALIGGIKQEKTDDVKDLESPTSEGGRPIPVIFGEVEITGLNCLWSGEKSSNTFEIDA